MSTPLLLKMTAAARQLGVSKSSFLRLVDVGAVPPGRLLPGQRRGQVWHVDVIAAAARRLAGVKR